MKENKIYFNIWDDYYDDGYVPAGKIQETYGYIEGDLPETEDEKEKAAKVVYEYIQTLDMSDVDVEYGGEQVYFEHLTHVRREQLVKELQQANLQYNGLPFVFYSES